MSKGSSFATADMNGVFDSNPHIQTMRRPHCFTLEIYLLGLLSRLSSFYFMACDISHVVTIVDENSLSKNLLAPLHAFLMLRSLWTRSPPT